MTLKVIQSHHKPRGSTNKFLLTFNRNYSSISYRFWDISTCLLNRRYVTSLTLSCF